MSTLTKTFAMEKVILDTVLRMVYQERKEVVTQRSTVRENIDSHENHWWLPTERNWMFWAYPNGRNDLWEINVIALTEKQFILAWRVNIPTEAAKEIVGMGIFDDTTRKITLLRGDRFSQLPRQVKWQLFQTKRKSPKKNILQLDRH